MTDLNSQGNWKTQTSELSHVWNVSGNQATFCLVNRTRRAQCELYLGIREPLFLSCTYVTGRALKQRCSEVWPYTEQRGELLCAIITFRALWNSGKEGKEKRMIERQQDHKTSHLWRQKIQGFVLTAGETWRVGGKEKGRAMEGV
jgi:hypothetical protein